jgi:molybdate transport system substrate-binding protein
LITRRAGLGLAALALAGWFGLGVPGSPALAQAKPALVFAAASLKNALDEIAAQYERETGKKVTLSYGASSALAKQIEAAAPADLFISADLDWMDYLQTRNLIKTETRGNMLGNRLVLVAPKDSPASIKIGPGFPLVELLGGGRLAMADPKAVPAGSTAGPHSSRSACGRRSSCAWRRPRTCARPWRSSPGARRRWASSTRPTRPRIRT